MGPLSEQERRVLHEAAERTMGQPAADALLRGLPPVDWREFATKSDLAVLRTDLTLEFTKGMKALEDKLVDRFDTKIDGKIGALDGKIGALDTKIGALDTKIDTKIDALAKAIQAQGRWQTKLTVTLFIALLTVPSFLPFGRTAAAPAPADTSLATPSPGGDLSTAPPKTGLRGMGAR